MDNEQDRLQLFKQEVYALLHENKAANRVAVISRYEKALARAERAEVNLRELRENILLGFGMTTEEVAAIDDDLIDTTISYLLSGHAELVARVAELEAQLAAAQPAIEAWAQYQADNERRAQLQEDMIAEGLIKRPFWQEDNT